MSVRRACWVGPVVAMLAVGCGPAQTPVTAAAAPVVHPAVQTANIRAQSVDDTAALSTFFGDLRRLESGEPIQLHILQIGDSHTAGDFFSGRLRTVFQDRFGNGGRGMMPPGHPYNGLRQKDVTVSQIGRWAVWNSLTAPEKGPYGLSGFVVTSLSPGASLSLTAVEPTRFDTFSVDFLRHPGGGHFLIRLDGRTAETVSELGPKNQTGHVDLRVAEGTRSIELVTLDKGTSFTNWAVGRADRGVVLDSFGVVGATVDLVNHWDDAIVQRELDELNPSLIILAYGTNEGVTSDLNAAGYAATFADVVRRLRRLDPRASILIVGPPDVQRPGRPCPHLDTTCRWYTPATLAMVRNSQRQVAHALDAAFWDWSSVMPGGIHPLVIATPPLARKDHVHFTPVGYEMAADSLFADLMQSYERYKQER